jgi:glutaredoxin-related protein
LFDTIGIYHCKILKILAYFKNHIGINYDAVKKSSNRLYLKHFFHVIDFKCKFWVKS